MTLHPECNDTNTHTDKHTLRQTDRQTYTQTDRQTDRQTYTQIDRQTDTDRRTQTHICDSVFSHHPVKRSANNADLVIPDI